jgi:general secretion pathway protein F
MAHFRYQALDARGARCKGSQEAADVRHARALLRERGLSPLVVEQASHTFADLLAAPRRTRLGAADLALMTRQLATLVQSSVPVEEALDAVGRQCRKARHRALLLSVRGGVLEGQGLATCLRRFAAAFPELYCATVAAGEQSGHLGIVLEQLADYTEARHAARQRIQMALVYPLILMLASVSIVGFLLGFVVPDVMAMFIASDQQLPTLTRGLILLSGFTEHYGGLLLALMGAAGFALVHLLRRPAFRRRWHAVLLHVPVFGSAWRASDAARFASTLSILGKSAVPLVDALRIAASVVGNCCIRERLEQVARSVGEGETLTQGLTRSGDIPPLMLHLIASGERVGELDRMLERAAQQQEKILAARIALSVSLFEPLMLVVMGAVVLLIVMAILLPILSLNQLVN